MPREKNNDLKIGELPNLRIVPVAEVVFHEEPDMERVAKLVDRFGADGVLKNPPVVARRDGSTQWILLDGANRITALRKLDYPHVLVQMIDFLDPSLQLDHWHHAVEYLTSEQFLDHAANIAGVTIATEEECPPTWEEFLCRLTFVGGESVVLAGSGSLFEQVKQLKKFTNLYHHQATMDRVSYTNMEHLGRNYRNFTALVTFARFDREQLADLTDAGLTLPSGITRVLLPKRALRFNLQLDFLRSRLSTEEKNQWLEETIQQKISDKNIRFYREPTFFFDE